MVTEKVIELGDKKEMVTKEDLPYIISDVLRSKRVEEMEGVLERHPELFNEKET